MPTLRIFVSFEYDRDNDLKNNFFRQAEQELPSPVLSSSLNRAYETAEWEVKARTAIRGSDIVIVLVGRDTHNAPGVQTEVSIARELGMPILQIVPQNRTHQGVPNLPRPIKWKWETIRERLSRL